MKEKMFEADRRKVCAFQELKIRGNKEYITECKLMYTSKNPIWSHECKSEICPMYQTWQILKEKEKV